MDDNQDDKKILEHMPYLSLLIEDMKEVNRSIRMGGTGEKEISILLADIPAGWTAEIQPMITKINNRYDEILGYAAKYHSTMKGYDKKGGRLVTKAGIDRTFALKPLILSILDEKGILLLTRKNLAGKSFRIDDMDSE